MVYPAYKPDRRMIGWFLCKMCLLAGLIAYLFYNSFFGIFAIFPITFFCWSLEKKKYIQRQKNILRTEFKNMIISLLGNLNAGYSLENAFLETGLEMKKLYGTELLISEELENFRRGISCNVRIEDLLRTFGVRSEIEEIQDFANMLVSAKEHGGNMLLIIRRAVSNLSARCSLELEIETLISAKKLEGMIMLGMPFLIVAYMRLTNGEYLMPIYTNLGGRILMTIGLILVILCAWLVGKITEIEV